MGKSYGRLQSKDRQKFENLNCNNVAAGKNPSCDDVSLRSSLFGDLFLMLISCISITVFCGAQAWGDGFVHSWRANAAPEMCGDSSEYSSRVSALHCSR